jgi:hypothetical protein
MFLDKLRRASVTNVTIQASCEARGKNLNFAHEFMAFGASGSTRFKANVS